MRPGTRVLILEDDVSRARLVEPEPRRLVPPREGTLESVWQQDFYAEANAVDAYPGNRRERLGAGEGDRLSRPVRGAVTS
jgi:DNA-binding response OmpR family regulator